MTVPITVSPDWIQEHAKIAAWALGALAVTLVSLGMHFSTKLFTALNSALDDISQMKNNHLTHIEASTTATRDETIKTNAKLDVLISVIERKL
jgi:hypothetical protein